MKSTLRNHIANGIRRLFCYTSFANVNHFVSTYEKKMFITNDGLAIKQIGDNVYKFTIDFGDTKAEIELVFVPSNICNGRITLKEVR